MDEKHERGAPLLVGLRPEPLGLVLTTPTEGRQYIAPLTKLQAQSLAYALLAIVGAEPTPEYMNMIREAARSRAAADMGFLSACGAQGVEA